MKIATPGTVAQPFHGAVAVDCRYVARSSSSAAIHYKRENTHTHAHPHHTRTHGWIRDAQPQPPTAPHNNTKQMKKLLQKATDALVAALQASYDCVLEHYKKNNTHVNGKAVYYKQRTWNRTIKPLYEAYARWQQLLNYIVNYRKQQQGNPPRVQELRAAASQAGIPEAGQSQHNPQKATAEAATLCSKKKSALKGKIKTETRQLMHKIMKTRNTQLLRTYKTNPKEINKKTFTDKTYRYTR